MAATQHATSKAAPVIEVPAGTGALPNGESAKALGHRGLRGLAKGVRVATVAPAMALLMLTVLFVSQRGLMGGVKDYVLAIVFLVVMPVLAYPLQPLIPGFKGKGREGQRTLAMIFCVAGYVGGVITAAVSRASHMMWTLYLTYLFSGMFVTLFNKVFSIRASGHACGVAGPLAVLGYFNPSCIIAGIAILAAVYWSSLYMKRHTLPQLLAGTAIPIVSLGLAALIVSFM